MHANPENSDDKLSSYVEMSMSSTSVADGRYKSDDHYYDEFNNRAYGSTYNLEEKPHIDLYRRPDSISGDFRERPAIVDLHESKDHQHLFQSSRSIPSCNLQQQRTAPDRIVKLGWCSGIVMRGVLSIIGQLLFLRLSWIMGEAGLILGLSFILFSVVINLFSTLSLCAVATNGLIEGGGTYFLLSRTLGAEWGLVTGVLLSVSNCLFASSCLIGFAETVRTILTDYGIPIITTFTNDLRIISNVALVLLIVVVIISIRFETAFMYVLLVMLIVSILNFIVGAFLNPNLSQLSKGFIGISKHAFKANLRPKLSEGTSLGEIMGIVFTAMTGVLAGVNMSENLKNPNDAIPKGTITATILSGAIYIITGFLCIFTTLPNAPGSPRLMFNLPENYSIQNCTFTQNYPLVNLICPFPQTGVSPIFNWEQSYSAKPQSGLLNDYNMMKSISAFGPLTYAGIIAASLSSASANFVAGPKVFQALCRDNILPRVFSFFAVGAPRTDEPRRAYLLTFFVVAVFNLIANLNVVSLIAAESTMICYVLINYACSSMVLSRSLGWRPSFRFHNGYLSQITMVVTFIMMFVVDWKMAIVTCVIVAILHISASRRNLAVDWGSSTQAKLYTKGLCSLQKYVNLDLHVKHFRPQCLVLSGYPTERQNMLYLVRQIVSPYCLVICGNILMNDTRPMAIKSADIKSAQQFLNDNKYKFFYCQVDMNSFRDCARSMMQCCGIGQIRPNILTLGFKNDFRNQSEAKRSLEYFNTIHDAYDIDMGVMIIRTQETTKLELWENDGSQKICSDNREFTVQSAFDDKTITDSESSCPYQQRQLNEPSTPDYSLLRTGSIDLWWLFDDGGLSALLPHMLNQSTQWKNCRLRVFGILNNANDREAMNSMTKLLSLMRIKCDHIEAIDQFDEDEEREGFEEFNQKVEGFFDSEDPWNLSREDVVANQSKNLRHIRLRNLVRKYSSTAEIVFITMMIPRKKSVPGPLFLSWLDFIGEVHPLVCFVRGNQENVLTHYT